MTKATQYPKGAQKKMKKALVKAGADPSLVKEEDISVNQQGNSIRIVWRDVAVEMPPPSNDTWDKVWMVAAGALAALAGVAVGIWASKQTDE